MNRFNLNFIAVLTSIPCLHPYQQNYLSQLHSRSGNNNKLSDTGAWQKLYCTHVTSQVPLWKTGREGNWNGLVCSGIKATNLRSSSSKSCSLCLACNMSQEKTELAWRWANLLNSFIQFKNGKLTYISISSMDWYCII